MKKDEILTILEEVLFGVSEKGLFEEMAHVVFYNGTILTYNDSIAVSAALPDGEGGFQCGVNAQAFYHAIKSIRTKNIAVEFDKALSVIGGKTTITLPVSKSTRLQELHNSIDVEHVLDYASVLPSQFIQSLKSVAVMASDNIHAGQGMAYVRITPKSLESSNGVKAGYVKMPIKISKEVYIPKTIISEVLKFNPQEIAIDDSWAHFISTEGTILSVHLPEVINGFPSPSTFIKAATKKIGTLEVTPEIVSSIEDYGYFSDGFTKQDKSITVSLSTNTLKLSIVGNKADVESELAIDYEGEEVTFVSSAPFLSEVLIGSQLQIFSISDNTGILVTQVDDGTYIVAVHLNN